MHPTIRAFADAVLARKVVARFVGGMEHATPEAREKYLHDHPNADPSDHKVKKTEKEEGEGEPKKEEDEGGEKSAKPALDDKGKKSLKTVSQGLDDALKTPNVTTLHRETKRIDDEIAPLLRGLSNDHPKKQELSKALSTLRDSVRGDRVKADKVHEGMRGVRKLLTEIFG